MLRGLIMSRDKVKIRFTNISGNRCVMSVYRSLLGTIYKALRNDDRVFDITIDNPTGVQMRYQEYVHQYGGLVIPE